MKKIIIFLFLFITIICNAQLNIVNKQPIKDKKIETGNCYIYRNTQTNDYYLIVMSNVPNTRNLFEVSIKLGNGPDEAINSIKQIEEMYENAKDGEIFTINGYKCFIDKGYIFGKLQFQRGEYENTWWDPIYYMRSYFGKLQICTLAIKSYNNGEF